jgi:transketolase
VSRRSGPTALVLSRQGLPVLDRDKFAAVDDSARGGYVLAAEEETLEVILIATGSEVHPALDARELLQKDGIGTRVVSLPSWELFDAQDTSWKDTVLPRGCALRVAVEAASPFGWERYIGSDGLMVGLERFGASAPGGVLMEHFGFTGPQIAEKVRQGLKKQ